MSNFKQIVPNLWFDSEAEEAANFYTSIFPNSRIVRINRYSEVGQKIHGRNAGTVMTVTFELNGTEFTALNGGPVFKFSEAISFIVNCGSQEEIDYYWDKLGEDGDENAKVCGWLKDKYGVSWQVIPSVIESWFCDENSEGAKRAMKAMLAMKKLDIQKLTDAYEGR